MIPITKIFESYIGKSIEDYVWLDLMQSHKISDNKEDIKQSFRWLTVSVDKENGKEEVDVSGDREVQYLQQKVEKTFDVYEDILCVILRKSLEYMDFTAVLETYFYKNKKLYEIGELLLIFEGLDCRSEYESQLNGLAKSDDVANKELFYTIIKSITDEQTN